MANDDSAPDLQQVYDTIQNQLDILSSYGIRATLICTGPDCGLTKLNGRGMSSDLEDALRRSFSAPEEPSRVLH